MDRTSVRAMIDVGLEPEETFEVLVDELTRALADLDVRLEPGEGGRLVESEFEVGRIVGSRAARSCSRGDRRSGSPTR